MAVIDQDTFSNISWNSDQRTDDEGASPDNTNTHSNTNNNNNYTQSKNGGSTRMADDDFDQPLSPSGGKQKQKQSQKQKQKQPATGGASGAGGSNALQGEGLDDLDYDAHDANVLGPEILQCRVFSPLTENEGGSNPFTSYLVTTTSTFPTFQKPTVSVRRRFTDFLYLYNSLTKDFPQCAVPPIPDKQRMVRVTGDRFGPDFTNRRAYSLQRFLFRLSQHPVLRRAPLLHSFLESGEWNATMRSHSVRVTGSDGSGYGAGGSYGSGGGGGSGSGGGGSEQGATSSMFDAFADSFINVFTKVHRLDRRFVEVREKSDRLDEDLNHVEKVVARVVRREADLEADLKDLAEQFQKLITLEPGVEDAVRAFAASVEDTAAGLRGLRDITDQDYLSSLRDMVAYSGSLKNLLKAREQKQLDYEQLTEYLNKSTADRDHLAMASGGYYHSGLSAGGSGSATGGPRRDSSSASGSGAGGDSGGGAGSSSQSAVGGVASSVSSGVNSVTSYVTGGGGGALAGASGFLRSKLEDVRGVDHEQSRRERQRKLELRVDELTSEVERAKKTSELFDEEVVKEVADFERIKRIEFKKQLGGLADAHIAYYDAVSGVWEAYLREMEKDGVLAA